MVITNGPSEEHDCHRANCVFHRWLPPDRKSDFQLTILPSDLNASNRFGTNKPPTTTLPKRLVSRPSSCSVSGLRAAVAENEVWTCRLAPMWFATASGLENNPPTQRLHALAFRQLRYLNSSRFSLFLTIYILSDITLTPSLTALAVPPRVPCR